MFLRNVDSPKIYTAPRPIRRHCSTVKHIYVVTRSIYDQGAAYKIFITRTQSLNILIAILIRALVPNSEWQIAKS
jgi:hypothetical protein